MAKYAILKVDYILLSGTEEWAKQHIDFLRIMSGFESLTAKDFSDDKLSSLLEYFSEDSTWGEVAYINLDGH